MISFFSSEILLINSWSLFCFGARTKMGDIPFIVGIALEFLKISIKYLSAFIFNLCDSTFISFLYLFINKFLKFIRNYSVNNITKPISIRLFMIIVIRKKFMNFKFSFGNLNKISNSQSIVLRDVNNNDFSTLNEKLFSL